MERQVPLKGCQAPSEEGIVCVTSCALLLAIPHQQIQNLPLVVLDNFLQFRHIDTRRQSVTLDADDEIKEGFNVGLRCWRRRCHP